MKNRTPLYLLASCFIIILNSSSACEALLRSPPVINVKSFGAAGDNKKDDTKSIQNAIDEAQKVNGVVHFPSGIYLASKLDIKASIKGSGSSVIKKLPESIDQVYEFCLIRNLKEITISDITFNGSVNSNRRDIIGSIPLFIHGSEQIKLIKCNFINSPMSGLRLESCDNISIIKCNSYNSKGIFGDGYYVENSSRISFQDCVADNYTRIGFVIERNSIDILLKGCVAQNGKNASVLSGGGEFNAGFWYEGSGFVTTINCTAKNNTHFGFVATSGIDTTLIKSSTVHFKYENCKSENSNIGFRVSSSGNPVKILLKSCEALNVNQGFIALARAKQDFFEFVRCKVDLITANSSSLNDIGFMWESSINASNEYGMMPSFHYKSCNVNYLLPVDTAKLFSRDVNNSDIGTYGGGSAKIYVEDFTNSLKGEGIIIKAIRGNPYYYIKNTRINSKYLVKSRNLKLLK